MPKEDGQVLSIGFVIRCHTCANVGIAVSQRPRSLLPIRIVESDFGPIIARFFDSIPETPDRIGPLDPLLVGRASAVYERGEQEGSPIL